MRSFLFLLLFVPALSQAQTYSVNTVELNGTYYNVSGWFQVDDESAVVQVGSVTTVYTFTMPIKIGEGRAWTASSGNRMYSVAVKDFTSPSLKGQTMLLISPLDGGSRKTYVGKVVK